MKTTEEIVNKIISDPREKEVSREVSRNFKYIRNNYLTLLEQFPNKWVALYGRRVIDHDHDYSALFERVSKKYEPEKFQTIVIYYIMKDKPKFLFHVD